MELLTCKCTACGLNNKFSEAVDNIVICEACGSEILIVENDGSAEVNEIKNIIDNDSPYITSSEKYNISNTYNNMLRIGNNMCSNFTKELYGEFKSVIGALVMCFDSLKSPQARFRLSGAEGMMTGCIQPMDSLLLTTNPQQCGAIFGQLFNMSLKTPIKTLITMVDSFRVIESDGAQSMSGNSTNTTQGNYNNEQTKSAPSSSNPSSYGSGSGAINNMPYSNAKNNTSMSHSNAQNNNCTSYSNAQNNTSMSHSNAQNNNDAPSVIMAIAGFFLGFIGLFIYGVMYQATPRKAKSCLKGALVNMVFCFVYTVIIVISFMTLGFDMFSL